MQHRARPCHSFPHEAKSNDRRKNDDVLEWIMFLNLHADMLYSIVWGDKDTYRLAFHLANKSQGFAQVRQGQSQKRTIQSVLAVK